MTDQFAIHALVQLPFCGTALEETVVVVLKTGPVYPELLQAVLVDIFDAAAGASAMFRVTCQHTSGRD